MNVLLINPPTPRAMQNFEFVTPSSLLYLAAAVRQAGFEVSILDLNVLRPWLVGEEEGAARCRAVVLSAVDQRRPELAGVTCLYSGQTSAVRELVGLVKAASPRTRTVIGGLHPTLFAREFLEHVPELDYVILGEGEPALVTLVRGLEDGSERWGAVDGFAFRGAGGEVRVNPKTSFMSEAELDALALPAYDLVDFDQYAHDTSRWHNPRNLPIELTVPLISTRSCPMRCSFCSMYHAMGKRLRRRSPVLVADEIERLYRDYGRRHFSFMDDNIALNNKHFHELCEEIIKRKLVLQFETPNGLGPAHLTEELIDHMVRAGWVRGAIAIESGSDYMRNVIMRKRLPDSKIRRVVETVGRYPQVWLKAYFIIGMPEETHQTLHETYQMIEELDLDEPQVSIALPLPGTELYAQCVRDGLLTDLQPQEMWCDDQLSFANRGHFFLKPYQMEIPELLEWHGRFEQLVRARREARAGRRRDPALWTQSPGHTDPRHPRAGVIA